MALPGPFSLVDFADHINRTDAFASTDALEAQMHVEAAIELVESLCGPMAPREVTEVLAPGDGILEVTPVLSIDAVVRGDGVAASPADLVVSGQGVVRWAAFSTWYGATSVTYTAGRDPIPQAMILATYIIASHLWDTQRGKSARPALTGAGEDFTSPGGHTRMWGPVPVGFAIPNRAADLLQPYLRVVLG